MKNIIFALLLLTCVSVYAQKSYVRAIGYVRIYDLQGNILAKGKIHSFSDNSLQLFRAKNVVSIPVSSIGSIRTKRPALNNVFVGAAIGASSMAIFGAATAPGEDEWFGFSAAEGALGFGILGAGAGALGGGVVALLNRSVTFKIDGNIDKWDEFTGKAGKPLLAQYPDAGGQ